MKKICLKKILILIHIYQIKVLFYIQENPNEGLVQEVQHLIKPTEASIEEFKNKVIDIAKTAEEYNEVFSEYINLVIFVRRNIELNPLSVEAFIEKERSKGFNESFTIAATFYDVFLCFDRIFCSCI